MAIVGTLAYLTDMEEKTNIFTIGDIDIELLEYGEIKGRFDAESCNCCFSESKIASYQKQMQTAFMEAAKNEAWRSNIFDS